LEVLERHMRSQADALQTAPVSVQLTALEKKAAKMFPKPTEKVKANGYGGYREFLPRQQFVRGQRGDGPRFDRSELQLLVNGRNSVLDIKNMLDAQSERKAELQAVLDYIETLKTAGLVVMN